MNIEKVNSQRRYYLHNRLKDLVTIKAWIKTGFIPIDKVNNIPPKKEKYIHELQDRFNYSFQLTTCEGLSNN